MKRCGFTLIELLVVIAIIAILAAILFPMFVTAKQRAQSTQCLSNMAQIGKGIIMYADQNNGCTPFAYYAPDWSKWDKFTWRERVVPYLKNKRVLICPTRTYKPNFANTPDPAHWQTPSPYWPTYWKQVHYGMNVRIAVPSAKDPWQKWGYHPLSGILRASQTIMVTENRDGDWSGEPYNNDVDGSDGQFHAYHGGKDTMGGNFIFCDGHASFMPVARTQATISGMSFYYWLVYKVAD